MSEPVRPTNDTGIQAGLPTAPLERADAVESIAYRPISGWAIAGAGVGGLFAVLVAASTAVALWQGAPMFFPVWIVGLAIVGVVLSLVGQRHVQNSEGTRAGAKLARTGLWLSLVSGLSYLSYYFVTGLALQSQAHAFLMEKTDDESGFFPRLAEGGTDPVQLNAAFLLTRPPRQREGIKPENEIDLLRRFDVANQGGMPGELSIFKFGMAPQSFHSALPRIFFKGNAKDVKVTEQGVQEWKYEQKSYMVYRKYRIETRELDWDVTLVACSAEAESAGQGRKWFVNLGLSGMNRVAVTRFGEGIMILRAQSREKLNADLRDARAFSDIRELDRTDWDNRFGEDYLSKRALVHKLFASTGKDRFEPTRMWAKGDEVGQWEDVNGKIRIYHSLRFTVPKESGDPYSVDGYAVLETVGAVDPAQHHRAAPPPAWNLIRLVFTSIAVQDKKGLMQP